MHGYHSWGISWGWIINDFFLFLIIWIIARNVNQNYFTPKNNSALDILKECYVNGEIGKEEFDQKKNDLA